MTLTQAILYCVLIVLICTAAWLAGETDGKRRGYKKGYEEGKACVRATPDYRAFLLRRAEQEGLIKIETRADKEADNEDDTH